MAFLSFRVERPKGRPMEFVKQLQKIFNDKQSKRANYSLRSFARTLGVDPSLLSKVIGEKRKPSLQFIKRVGVQLEMEPNFLKKCLNEHMQKSNYKNMNMEHFALLSNPIHFEVLELIKTKNFIEDYDWMATRLRTNKKTILGAVKRLKEFGYIDDSLNLTKPDNTWVDLKHTQECKQIYQKKLLDKAKDAIDFVPIDKRENYSLSLACSEELLPEIKLRISKFIRELDQFVEEKGAQGQVYQSIVSFFPVTELENEKNEFNK